MSYWMQATSFTAEVQPRFETETPPARLRVRPGCSASTADYERLRSDI